MLRYARPAGFIVIVFATVILAQPKAPATRPASAATTRPAPEATTKPAARKATVKSLEGIAERRDLNVKNGKWKPMKVGDVLSEHTLIRTGLRGKVVLQFAGGNDVNIKSGSKVLISSSTKDGKKIKPRGTLSARDSSISVPQWPDFTFQTRGRPVVTTRPATEATTKPAAMKATVKSVKGIAEKCDFRVANSKWKQMKVGDILPERTIIRTGLGGRAVLHFGGAKDVTVKSGTMLGIATFRKSGKKVKVRLRVKYGAVHEEIESSHGDIDFRVQRGGGTISARGGPGIGIPHRGGFMLRSGRWPVVTTRPAPEATTKPAARKATVKSLEGVAERRDLNVKNGELVRTRLGLKYGAIRKQIDSSRGDNNFRLRTPVSPPAARRDGGATTPQWGDFSWYRDSEGLLRVKRQNGFTHTRPDEWTNYNVTTAAIRIAESLANTDDMGLGLTKSELFDLIVNGAGRGRITHEGPACIRPRPANRKAPTTQPSSDTDGCSQ